MDGEIFDENYREYKLDNGLVVALQKTHTKTINVQLSVSWGFAHKKRGEEGLTHLLEHVLVMGGTKNYTARKAQKIFNSFGEMQATTKIDETAFSVDMLCEDLEKYLDFISSVAFSPRLDKKIIEQQKQVILREIADNKSGPAYIDGKNFRKLIYPKKHPFILDGFGKESVINSATQEDLRKFHSKGYNATNMELVLVGGLPDNTEKLVEKYFVNKPSGKNMKFQFPLMSSLGKRVIMHTSAPDIYNYENPEESNSYVLLCIFVPPKTHKDCITLDILSEILIQGKGSRIYNEISQKKGLSYNIGGGYDGQHNCGRIKIEGNINSKRQDEAVDLIFREFNKLQKKPINKVEFGEIKRYINYFFLKTYETNLGSLNVIRRKLEWGFTPEYYLSKLNAITPEKLQEAAVKYLPKSREDNYALLIRDPLKK